MFALSLGKDEASAYTQLGLINGRFVLTLWGRVAYGGVG